VKLYQDKGQCQVCKKINHTSIWKVFAKTGWFRGDDKYLGKVCKKCRGNFLKKQKEKLKQ
jgi:hypothetical protein